MTTGKKRATLFICSMLGAGILLTVVIGLGRRLSRSQESEIYIIPSGFTGLVRVTYNVKGAPALQNRSGEAILVIPKNGNLTTSTRFVDGLVTGRYYYGTVSDSTRLFDGTEGLKAGEHSHTISVWPIGVTNADGVSTYESFYVGTSEQKVKFEREHGSIYE